MTPETYYVIDLETTVKNKGEESIGKFKASPFHPDNHVVLSGFKLGTDSTVTVDSIHLPVIPPTPNTLLVGHNIGFDLLHLMKESREWREWFLAPDSKIWDTMIVEYILSGQQETFPSLDYCAMKYSGTLKDDRIKDYWESGMETEDIPHEELKDYLVEDVLNTEIVFLEQLLGVDAQGKIPLLQTQMEARMATIEMEYNGMYFDKDSAQKQADVLTTEMYILLGECSKLMLKYLPKEMIPNPSSTQQVSSIIFGGNLNYTKDEDILDEEGCAVVYKTGPKKGRVKTRKVKCVATLPQQLDPTHFTTKGKTHWKLDTAVLKKVAAITGKHTPVIIVTLAEKLLRYREIEKDLSSFYIGYSNLVWYDGMIHPTYNHTSTATGRLSCSTPNLQQASNK